MACWLRIFGGPVGLLQASLPQALHLYTISYATLMLLPTFATTRLIPFLGRCSLRVYASRRRVQVAGPTTVCCAQRYEANQMPTTPWMTSTGFHGHHHCRPQLCFGYYQPRHKSNIELLLRRHAALLGAGSVLQPTSIDAKIRQMLPQHLR
ncbi:hypothetical protein BDV95DRAFT_369204 [Massariosphaeria phaeospora]|uniref:Fatty acid desaturase domain-containing protein n=1 Tax=Massariosphaeria phaeospora TaxID=100035 RepID=A0A7C8I853_9PLEO|nr:hypothetical protein BDV95DRAFT_369204 [Massariosphaeria phaeospora]